jgi:hypothetical protein
VLKRPLVAALKPKISDGAIRAAFIIGMTFWCLSVLPISLHCQTLRGVPLGMSRIHPECPDPDPPDRSVAANVLVREEPDEEEDDEEGDGEEKEGEEEGDEGYSE